LKAALRNYFWKRPEGALFFTEGFVKSLKELAIIERRDERYHLTKPLL
jgi:hypothetical protein